MPFAKVALLVS